ncbi:aspartate/glutamate racemase family protein [Dongia soli]|uniref:Asp/Glu racemase n=1 Tax=Dongia soli TaxID=600628 RepID=A0ABU5EI53_9PROT|nr:aspartate/glutamate racemase family protein [Dongia soli]MDY0885866.1 Asp/Glu racemase [Dongia soli]
MSLARQMSSEGTLQLNRSHLPFTLDRGIAHRAKIGLIVLATDNTLEYEFRRIFTLEGVALYQSRIPSPISINPTSLKEMETGISAATSVILPGIDLDVVAYACTSGTVVIGEENVFARIRDVRPRVACSTPITAAIAGLKVLRAKRIALLTPYIDSVNQMLRAHIEARGIAVPVVGSFNHENDNEVARISLGSLRAAVLELGRHPQVDAVFVSCTSLRLAEIADDLERELGKPVTSSNHALAWHCLRLAGIADPLPQWGRLFTARL